MRRVFVVSLSATLLLFGSSIAGADSELIYLESDGNDRYRPTLDDGGNRLTLADIDSITAPAVSPDARTVAFAGAVGDESLGNYALFLVQTDGSGLTQLTSATFGEFDPNWAPDGSSLVAVQNSSGALTAGGDIVRVDASTGVITSLAGTADGARPEFDPSGAFIVYDRPNGVFRVGAQGGASTQIVGVGYDATVSPDGSEIAYLYDGGTSREIRKVSIFGGTPVTVYSTSRRLENPEWVNGRIHFTQFLGVGYDGRNSVQLLSMTPSGADLRTEFSFSGRVVGATVADNNDEMFFYRNDGFFQYYDIDAQANLGGPINEGTGFSAGWTVITAIDLDGDRTDEMLFYRATDGTFKYYETTPGGALGPLINGGTGYSNGWSSITAVDLDGDDQDEIMFYRSTDGAYRYYDIGPDASLGARLQSGSGYSTGWSTITAVDLEGDGSDEMLFYRSTDGTFKYYDMKTTGALGALIQGGTGYSTGWSSITSIDLDGDRADEIFFYRSTSGAFSYYEIRPDASLGTKIASGAGYTTGWTSITRVALD